MTTYEQALSKAMALCSKSEKCISEIKQKLFDWGVEPSDKQKIIDYLVRERFIDESRFVNYYVRDKFKFNQWGKVKIGFMLKGKQLPPDLIAEALNNIDEEAYIEQLERMLAEKARKTKFTDAYDRKAKLTRFAQSRGFEYEAIDLAIKRIAKP
jgi:regulatory protein